MGEQADGGEQPREQHRTTDQQIFQALSHARRWTVLSVLDREGPMDVAGLVAAVQTEESERDGADTGTPEVDDDGERVRLTLEHVHLPKLEAAGLVSWTDDTVRVCLDGHDTVPDVRAFVDTDRRSAARNLGVLCTTPRRTVCTVLSDAGGPMELGTVATEVRQLDEAVESAYTHDSLRVELHHVHLPVLDQAGIVRYDHATHVAELASASTVFEEAA